MGPLGQRSPAARVAFTTLDVLVVLGLLAIGLYAVPLALFAPGFANIPGDLGDSRFNNYILEHYHQYITGHGGNYWDAPFMFPFKNVIAFSDNLLGTAPLYSLFRSYGIDREGSYQLWIIALFALDYLCCWLALWKWTRNAVVAAAGAYIFAFGIYNIAHVYHLQMLPKFPVPLAFWWCWRWLRTKDTTPFVGLMLACVFQFYCGMYLGFLLLYALLFFVLAYIAVERGRGWRVLRERRLWAWQGATLVAGAFLMLPLMRHYLAIRGSAPVRSFEDIEASIPRPVSYFYTHPAALSWRSLAWHSDFAFPQWWDHHHFMGALPWAAILLAPVVLLRKRTDPALRRRSAVALLALGLCLLFCLNVGGFSLYRVFFALPGYSSLRSMDRLLNVEAMLFVLVFALVFQGLLDLKRYLWPLALGLCAIAVVENKWDARELKSYDKYRARQAVDAVAHDIQVAYDSAYTAVAYLRVLPYEEGEETVHDHRIATHITAMLAAQQLHVPIVNAYTGGYPGDYLTFFDAMDRATLDRWCAFNGYDPARIQRVDNVGFPLLHCDTVTIRSRDGFFVSDDHDRKNLAVADRTIARRWELFVRLRLSDSTYAFLANSDRFLCAELDAEKQLSTTALRLGDFGVFRAVPMGGDTVAFRCDNGRYASLDPRSRLLHATADSIGINELFVVQHAQPR